MKPHEAVHEIKQDLTASFGEGLAARILFSARDSVQAPIVGLDKEKYLELVKALCHDERVKGMWGDFGLKEKLTKWEKLL